MKKTYYIIIIVIFIVVTAAYLYVHFATSKIKDPKPGDPKPQSAIDLRPLMIAKLQQLVKEGSNGLYSLSIEKLEPDILQSELYALNIKLIPDSAALKVLDSAKKIPDNVFKISFDSLHITGITPEDFLHKDEINFDSVFITKPIIEVNHLPRPYNKVIRERDDSATLYQRLMKQLKTISVNTLVVRHGTFINKDLTQKNKIKRFNDVSIYAKDLLIDSSTQYDKSRFLFTKEARLSCKDYVARTPDSLYIFKISSLSVDATKHTLTVKNLLLKPRGDEEEFQKKLSERKDRFDIEVPKIVLTNVDWWKLANNENFFAKEVEVYNAELKNYLDRSLPAGVKPVKNFPGQLLLRVPLKINIEKLNFHDLDITYKEYNPTNKKSGKIYFENVNGTFRNITNVSSLIKKNKKAQFSGSCLFMHQIPLKCSFQFDLSKYKTGDFLVDFHIAAMDKTIVNSFAESLGMISIKSGALKEASVSINGNNSTTHGKILLLYNDLHITPLKPNDDTSKLQKKTVTSFFANTFLIKDDNPSHGNMPRNVEVFVQRKNNTFFNLIWKTVLTGILKTVGIPAKYADK